MPIVVKRSKASDNDDVIGRFRRLSMEEDITEEVKKREAYEKPSQARYAKKKVILWRKKCRRRAAKRTKRDAF